MLTTFNRPLFDAQVKTLCREIAKRRRKLDALQTSLSKYRSKRRGKAPTVAGITKTVDLIHAARHMKDLFKTKVSEGKDGLPLLTFRFDKRAWKTLRKTLLGKTILFTDQDHWTDEQIVLSYRAQFHVEAAFRQMKDPHFLTFRPTFHWTDQKLRVHAFYCVLALMLMSLLRRSLARKNIPVSFSTMIDALADIHEVTLLYPAPPQQKNPFVRVALSKMNDLQQKLSAALALERYRSA